MPTVFFVLALFQLPHILSFDHLGTEPTPPIFPPRRAIHGTLLPVPTVFFVLALFQLPRTSMIIAFTFASQTITELRVSLTRIDRFLSTPEPPLPSHKVGRWVEK